MTRFPPAAHCSDSAEDRPASLARASSTRQTVARASVRRAFGTRTRFQKHDGGVTACPSRTSSPGIPPPTPQEPATSSTRPAPDSPSPWCTTARPRGGTPRCTYATGPWDGPAAHTSGPISRRDNGLPSRPWRPEGAPGLPKSGTKWQYLGRFSSVRTPLQPSSLSTHGSALSTICRRSSAPCHRARPLLQEPGTENQELVR
jgi:hypothetical protein